MLITSVSVLPSATTVISLFEHTQSDDQTNSRPSQETSADRPDDSTENRQYRQSEEEVPMNAIFRHMFLHDQILLDSH